MSTLKKDERSQINNLTLHLKELEKKSKELKANRKKEILSIRLEISEIEYKKQLRKPIKSEVNFEKSNKNWQNFS